jgi:glutaredoxin
MRFSKLLRWSCSVCAVIALGCGNPVDGSGATAPHEPQSPTAARTAAPEGTPVTPPFSMQGELDGLLLTWFDAQGLHPAHKRSEIPEASRQHVRVDSLSIAPDKRLDPELIYLADLRAPAKDGGYPVRSVQRAWFEAQIDLAKPPPAAEVAAASDVIIYMASWCGACRSAAALLRERNVPFAEKDVEKEAGARAEMLEKARAKGLVPNGVPVIDFRGEILLGFDRGRLEQLIARDAHPKPI